MRARFIFEKFEEDSDPIKDMGIGSIDIIGEIKNMYNYNDANTVSDETLERINTFLNKFLNKEIEGKFKKWVFLTEDKCRFIPIAYDTYFGASRVVFYDKFGFYYEVIPGERYMTSAIFEKFQEDSDPIKDMGIGLPEFWKRQYEELGKMTIETGFAKYFPKDYVNVAASQTKIINLLYRTLKYVVTENFTPQKSFVKMCVWSNLQYNYPNEVEVRKMVADVLKKHFYMKVNPDFKWK